MRKMAGLETNMDVQGDEEAPQYVTKNDFDRFKEEMRELLGAGGGGGRLARPDQDMSDVLGVMKEAVSALATQAEETGTGVEDVTLESLEAAFKALVVPNPKKRLVFGSLNTVVNTITDAKKLWIERKKSSLKRSPHYCDLESFRMEGGNWVLDGKNVTVHTFLTAVAMHVTMEFEFYSLVLTLLSYHGVNPAHVPAELDFVAAVHGQGEDVRQQLMAWAVAMMRKAALDGAMMRAAVLSGSAMGARIGFAREGAGLEVSEVFEEGMLERYLRREAARKKLWSDSTTKAPKQPQGDGTSAASKPKPGQPPVVPPSSAPGRYNSQPLPFSGTQPFLGNQPFRPVRPAVGQQSHR